MSAGKCAGLLVWMAWAIAPLIALGGPASAKTARCFTDDDGYYSCAFKATDANGSFEISAPGKPTYILIIDSPGVAEGFADLGTGRNVALPGEYRRDQDDGACWRNTETDTKICAW